jgi:3-hydroxybutyryl-CoA dehydratase
MTELATGVDLPGVKIVVTQEDIKRYAEVSRDFNPIHIDEEFARKTPLGGTIAHGMLVLAYISQMMTASFGQSWLTGSKLSVRFKAPARPGDALTITGKINAVEKSEELTAVSCTVLCTNQKDETIVIGDAHIKLQGN